MQNLIVYILFLGAIVYLFYQFFGKKKSKKSCGSESCGCH
ncbi:MAG: FeoB-associated Cys-rich membrane protein [Putridiphycobacter sp.]|nr:FeoB-associated Cys-rich membrane protein [Putridiphycobacter sp.]